MDVQFLIVGMDTSIGNELAKIFKAQEISFAGLKTVEVEFSTAELSRLLKKYKPNIVVNLNRSILDPDALASSISATEVQVLASVCEDAAIPLIHFSTNEVFEDEPQAIFTEKDELDTESERGKLLKQAEESIKGICQKYLIIRVSWLFSDRGENLLTKALDLLRKGESLQISDKRSVTPTLVEDAAYAMLAMVKQCELTDELWGTYQYTGAELTNLFDFVKAVGSEAGQFEKLPTLTIESDDGAHWNSFIPSSSVVMSSKKIMFTFGIKPKPWRLGLAKAVRALYTQDTAKTIH